MIENKQTDAQCYILSPNFSIDPLIGRLLSAKRDGYARIGTNSFINLANTRWS